MVLAGRLIKRMPARMSRDYSVDPFKAELLLHRRAEMLARELRQSLLRMVRVWSVSNDAHEFSYEFRTMRWDSIISL